MITTLVHPSGRYDEVTVGAQSFNFEPRWVALDGSGDLFIFNDSVKELVEASPNGKLLRAWQYYANAMATAPDGSVVIAEHGAALQRVTATARSTVVDFTTTKMADFGVPGSAGAFEPQGVAVAKDGSQPKGQGTGPPHELQPYLHPAGRRSPRVPQGRLPGTGGFPRWRDGRMPFTFRGSESPWV
jgi:hypothetical protein